MTRRRKTDRDLLDALLTIFEPDIKSAFLQSIQGISDNVLLKQLIIEIQNGQIENAFRTLGLNRAALRPLEASLERSFEQAGVLKGGTFPKYLNTSNGKVVFRFDVRNTRAETWLRNNSLNMLNTIEQDVRFAVRSALNIGMLRGLNPRTVALDLVGRIDRQSGRRVGGLIGLSETNIGWVNSARRQLENLDRDYFNKTLRDKRFDSLVLKSIKNGTPLSQENIEKILVKYKNNVLLHRGESIARTESVSALNQAEWEATKQAVDLGATESNNVKRIWDATGDSVTRTTHKRMDGQIKGLDEPFESPSGAKLMFPGDRSLGAPIEERANCRCRTRTKIDWLTDLE